MHKSYRGILYAIITAVLWGVLAIVLKISLNQLTPVDITWFRFFLAFVCLAAYYYFKKPTYLRILKKPPLLLVISTLCLATNYYGFIEGVHLTTPSVAQVFIQLGPVLLAVSGFALFKEKVNWRQIAGLTLVVLGLVIFYREQLHGIVTGKDSWQIGVLWVLIAAVTWAVYSVLLKILVLKHPPMQLNLVIFGLPVALYLPFVHFSHFTGIGFSGWMILLFLGLNTLFAYGLLALAIQYIEANKISVILVLNPLLTFAIMALLGTLGVTWIRAEHYTLLTIAGALVVLGGAILTILKKTRYPKAWISTNDH
ncbi:MAG TPA: DMT family transporter [Bacteroidales bacterium]|nr:DMT family transporter [Bacteroidales bacterium]